MLSPAASLPATARRHVKRNRAKFLQSTPQQKLWLCFFFRYNQEYTERKDFVPMQKFTNFCNLHHKKAIRCIVAFSLLVSIATAFPMSMNHNDNNLAISTGSVSRYQSDNNTTAQDRMLLLSDSADSFTYQSSHETAYINSSAVFIRSEPSDESEVLFVADYASKISIMGEDINQSNGWSKVYCNNISGFVKTKYLSEDVLFIYDPQQIYISNDAPLYSVPYKEDEYVVKTLTQNTKINQVGYNEDWLQVEIDDNFYYIDSSVYSADMIFIEKEKTMYLTRSMYLKNKPDSSEENNAIFLENRTKLTQVEYNDMWTKVRYKDDIYYVPNAYLSPYLTSKTPSSYKITFDDAEYTGDIAVVIEEAYNFLGTKYVWGKATKYQTDCSGLTLQCYAKVGISLPRCSFEQATVGRDVTNEDIRPGDVICFSEKGASRVSHVAIYVGDGMMIHAANSRVGCIASDLNNYCKYGGTIQSVRRFIE